MLEGVAGASKFPNHGQRVVAGQRLMQAASDIFLGWQRTTGPDGVDRDHYLRQLRDWKIVGADRADDPQRHGAVRAAVRVDAGAGPRPVRGPHRDHRVPGAQGHLRPGPAEFAVAYADRNEADYAALQAAVDSGKVVAQAGL